MRYIFILILSSVINSLFAQPGILQFQHYHADNGLPQNSVNCIFQDNQGFIWVGTQDGLCRFDGYAFKTYLHNSLVKNSLSDGYIWSIIQDSTGMIWIATFGGGVNRFDPVSETFTHFKWDPANPKSINSNNTFYLLDGGKHLWIATGDGFCKMDKATGTAQRYMATPGNADQKAANYVGSLVYREPGILWLDSDSGLTQFNVDENKLTFLKHSVRNDDIDLSKVTSLRRFGDKVYMVTPKGIVVSGEKNSFVYLAETGELVDEENLRISGILPISDGNYWINTSAGLIWFDSLTGKRIHYTHNPSDPRSLSNNNVLCLFRSKSGVLWVGTRGGLDKLDRESAKFTLITRQIGKENTLSHAQISGIEEDKYGRLWLGTPEGINVYDREKDSFYVFNTQSEPGQKITADYILDVHKDRDGIFWAGTKGGGLNKIIPDSLSDRLENARVIQYPLDNFSVQSICDGNNDNLWVGTSGGSLYRFNKKTDEFFNYPWETQGSGPSHPYIFYVFVDSFENVWLGTASGGVNLFDPVTSRFIYIRNVDGNAHSLSNNLVLSFFEDEKNRLWVGTTGGLNKLNYPLRPRMFDYFSDSVDVLKDSLFTVYNRSIGLPNDLIYGVLDDADGNFWISTNKGLVKFDPDAEDPVLKTWDVSDGLQSNEFNQNAFFKNGKGEMFFGGIGGLNVFHPDSIKNNPYLPPVHFTDFKLFNKHVPLKSERSGADFELEKAIHLTDNIELDYFHDVFTLDFASLNYINSGKNQYRYFMEGFNNDWVEAGMERSATYTNLDAGNYTFYVQGSNDDGVWSDQMATININVNPPPWLSWYAYLVYLILGFAVLYLIVRQRIRAATRQLETAALIERARSETKEEFRIKTSQDFHDEAGNKITKINLFTELAKKEISGKPELEQYLNRISKNTRELAVGMRDFIWALDPEKDTLYDTLLRLQEFGEAIFTDTGVPFHIEGLVRGFDRLKLNMDTRRAIMLIFKEAMNNCAKYAHAEQVSLKVELDGSKLSLGLIDDGRGFDPAKIKTDGGYGLKNMKSRAEKIGATLVILSEINHGTRILINLEIPQMRY